MLNKFSYLSNEKEFFLWKDSAHSAGFNMAIDEVLFQKVNEINIPILRIYEWSNKAISLGYTQKYEPFEKYLEQGYSLVRRITGGGAVFHNIYKTFTLIFPFSHPFYEKIKRDESYFFLNKILIEVFKRYNNTIQTHKHYIDKKVDLRSMDCFKTPTKYDITLENKKISGSAQRRSKLGLLHQAAIYLDNNMNDFWQLLQNQLSIFFEISFKTFNLEEKILKEAYILNSSKYQTIEWNKDKKICVNNYK